MADLKLKILFDAIDRVTAPIRAIRAGAAGLRTDVAQTAEKLRGLERSAQQLDKFRALKADAKRNGEALEAAQARVRSLATALNGAEQVTAKMRREFAGATAEAAKLKEAGQRTAQELHQLRTNLRSAGVDTGKMASEQKRLKAELAATTAAANHQASALAKVAARAKAMAGARTKMDKAQGVAGTMAGGGAAGMATGGGALAGIAATAMVGIDFEAQMSKVGALVKVDKTSESFQKLEKQAFDLGATTSFSASQAAEAMGNLAMAGFDAEKILGVMPGMLNLAKAGSTDLGQTASITANIMAGFGLQASQMGDVGDVLVATFTNSNTNLEMLGETMKYVAPIAKAAGYSLGDIATLAGLLGNVGIQGSDAGTAMRASLIRLAAPPKEAKEKLEELGVATKDVAGNMRPMASVLADIAEKTKNMGNAQKIETFSKVFGVEAAAAMTELVDKAGAGGIKEFANTVKQAHGLNDKISAQMADNAKGDLDNLSSAIEGVQIILTKLNIEPLRALTQWASNTVTAFGDWLLANPRLAATLTQIATVLAAVILAGGTLAVIVAGILGPFAMLRFVLTALGLNIGPVIAGFFGVGRAIIMGVVPALWTMTAALMANPIFWVVAAIAAAAAVLIIGWEPIAGFFAGLWARVSDAFGAGWAWVKNTLGFDPLAALAPYWEPIAGFFAGLWARVPATITAGWEGIKSTLGFDPLAALAPYWEPIAGFFTDLWARVPAAITAGWEIIKTLFGFTPLGLIVANWEPIAAFFTDLWARVPAAITTAWEGIKTLFGFTPLALIVANWEPIAAFFSGLWDGILAKVTAVWEAITAKIDGIKGVVDWAGGAWNSLFGDSKPAAPGATPAGASVAGTAVAPPIAIVPTMAATPAPANSNAPAPAGGGVHQTISITVHAAPGMTAEDVAREVARQMERQAAGQRSAARSALHD